MKNRNLFITCLCFFIFISCAVTKNTNTAKVKFITVNSSSTNCNTLKSGSYVITDSSLKMFGGILDYNTFDFSKFTVLAIVDECFNTGGYAIDIVKIVEFQNKLVCSYKKSKPNSNEIVTMSFTQPYHVVKIAKTIKKIEFKEMN